MPKTYFVFVLTFFLILAVALVAGLEERQKVDPVEDGFTLAPPVSRAPCSMAKTNGNAASYWGSYAIGTGTYTYFDPGADCGSPTYPFEITDFTFVLYDFAGVGQATVDIVVYDIAPSGNICDGPGAEKCRESMVVTTFYPDPVTYSFINPCCVNGPFFIGVEYTSGAVGTIPSVLYDDQEGVVDTCVNWMLYTDGFYYEWYDFWAPPPPGYPIFWVDGETVSPNCPQGCTWNPGDPHKMHYPQLPDEDGWDVNATAPVVLADDWMCTDSGWVKDIHFWGSWKDGLEGQIDYFVLSIHADIPVGAQFPCFADGDCNGDGIPLTVADMNYLMAYLFSGGPPPIPMHSADLNGDGQITVADLVVYQDYFVYGMSVFDPYGGYPVPTVCVAEYSRPGETLWEMEVWDFEIVPKDPPTEEGWYDPSVDPELILPYNHQAYFQYDVCLDSLDWFWQDSGTIYWLNISAVVNDPVAQWGWKSTEDHWNDDAVWAFWGDLNWIDLWEPNGAGSMADTNWYGIMVDPLGEVLEQWGTDHYGQGWYYYPQDMWWNIWFYDHPFTYDRYKEVWIEFDAYLYEPSQPAWLEFALNYSTDWWSIYGNPPGNPRVPPLPGDPEDSGIVRQIFFAEEWYDGHYIFPWTIPYYNPEWVSIDVRGYNYYIEGWIIHECIGDSQSLDLAFVITGGDEEPPPDSGACCYDITGLGINAVCVYTTQADCQNLGGVYEGDGVPCQGTEACCLPDGSCIMADALCCVNELGGVPQGVGSQCTAPEACCLPDGSCINADPLCCVNILGGAPQGAGTACTAPEACCLPGGGCVDADPLCCVSIFGGIPQGAGTACTAPQACCLPGGNCIMEDPLCCVSMFGGIPQGAGTTCPAGTIACCFPDGSCLTVNPICCDDLGGTPSPFGAPACLGDHNDNNIDDACEEEEDLKWLQLPDLDYTGIDVDASCPAYIPNDTCIILADDFLCEESGPITEIHIWGSWMFEHYPDAGPGDVLFYLSIHADVPAGVDLPWSHPGELLWLGEFQPGSFTYEKYSTGIWEGFYNPFIEFYEEFADTICWKYVFPIEEDPFIQEGSPDTPVIYWLNVQAMPDPYTMPHPYFGWKTSIDHWNDDAVWALGTDLFGLATPWYELRYPYPHPWLGESIDLAFAIYGGICDCIPGDANGDGLINVADAVYIINFVFKSGPPPTPYPICSGDANCDCIVNVADAVYLINYVFKNGPPPCTCEQWLARCGPPLRK